MRKKIYTLAALLLCAAGIGAQSTCLIEGELQGVNEGGLIQVFRRDGDVGHVVAMDTLRGGRIRLEVPVDDDGLTRFDLILRQGRTYSYPLDLWARPGTHIRLEGHDELVATWRVESDVPEQMDYQGFVEDSRDLLIEIQRLMRYHSELVARARTLPDEEKAVLRQQADSLTRLRQRLLCEQDARTLARLKQHPVNSIYMEKLKSLALAVKLYEGYPHREAVVALYEALPEAAKQSEEGQDIRSRLFPPVVVKEGEEMADADLYDLQGKRYRLADFKGKYILLDFWSTGCGPCLLAMPELKEVAALYEGRLAVVSLSIDNRSNWEKASQQHDISWYNLSDLQQQRGLHARYGVRAIPHYVLISPEGRVLKCWTGYRKGSLKQQMEELLK